MAKLRGTRQAFGAPGGEPRWTYGNKDGVGTAYAVSSRIWFTLVNGIVTEVYWPTIDRPQLRDLQYLVTDGGDTVKDMIREKRIAIRFIERADHTFSVKYPRCELIGTIVQHLSQYHQPAG